MHGWSNHKQLSSSKKDMSLSHTQAVPPCWTVW